MHHAESVPDGDAQGVRRGYGATRVLPGGAAAAEQRHHAVPRRGELSVGSVQRRGGRPSAARRGRELGAALLLLRPVRRAAAVPAGARSKW